MYPKATLKTKCISITPLSGLCAAVFLGKLQVIYEAVAEKVIQGNPFRGK